MKLTTRQLKQLIKEEIEDLSGNNDAPGGGEKLSQSKFKQAGREASKELGGKASSKERALIQKVADKLMQAAGDGNILKSSIMVKLERALKEIDKLIEDDPEAETEVPRENPF